MTEWFEQWFGEEYLRVYPHRDEDDAAKLISLIGTHVELGSRLVLDLACGPGRHARFLTEAGARVVGLDLSMPLLSRARGRISPPTTLVRGDMRYLPLRSAGFDVVVNLFTSFGYFTSDSQHQTVLDEVGRVLKPSGSFVLDFFNSLRVANDLVPQERLSVGAQTVEVERSISRDGRFVQKSMHLTDDGRSFVERVRLFTVAELEEMLDRAGLAVEIGFGDYHGNPISVDGDRTILIARNRAS